LECHFGNYMEVIGEGGETTYDRSHFDSRIPHEIRKTRPVVIVGDHKGSYVVVPISSTLDTHNNPRKTGVGRGYHIELREGEMPVTHFYEAGLQRWAKANMVQAVDRYRLASIYCRKQKRVVQAEVSQETLRLIQEAVVRVIGLSAMLTVADDSGE
jgi:uncharacterized protein YifN (PemK superfamily)